MALIFLIWLNLVLSQLVFQSIMGFLLEALIRSWFRVLDEFLVCFSAILSHGIGLSDVCFPCLIFVLDASSARKAFNIVDQHCLCGNLSFSPSLEETRTLLRFMFIYH